MKPAALGFRAHSGWAALVVVGGDVKAPEVVDRRRIEMADPKLAGSVQPYHAAEWKPLWEAAALILRLQDSAAKLAARGLEAAAEDVGKPGYEPMSCAILLASGRTLPALPKILSSHALIHTADGEHFRNALARASEGSELPIVSIRERDLPLQAEAALHRPAAELQAAVASWGKALGPPWTQDQKLAGLIAWVALATAKAL